MHNTFLDSQFASIFHNLTYHTLVIHNLYNVLKHETSPKKREYNFKEAYCSRMSEVYVQYFSTSISLIAEGFLTMNYKRQIRLILIWKIEMNRKPKFLQSILFLNFLRSIYKKTYLIIPFNIFKVWWNATVGQTLFLKHAKKLSNLIIAIQNKNKPIHQKNRN